MASLHTQSPLSHLWQLPLLLLSLALFGVAAYLFIDPQPGLSVDQRLEVARIFLRQNRPEAAVDQLNRLLMTERMHPEQQGELHNLMAEALELGQSVHRVNIPANHERIVEQTHLAFGQGVPPTAEIHRRLGESLEALGRPAEALSHYRAAAAIDSDYSHRLQKRVIVLQMTQGHSAAAEASLEAYLQTPDITPAERSWAMSHQAQLLIDRGDFLGARALLHEALRTELDPVFQGEIHFWLGYCAWKLEESDEAMRLLRLSREQLRVRHPLDARASYVLGRIHQEKREPQAAISFYQVVLVSHPDSPEAPLARLGRGLCRIMLEEDDAGLIDLHDLVNSINRRASRARHKDEALAGLRQAAEMLAARGNYQAALEVMDFEQALDEDPPPSHLMRLATLYEQRGDQLEQSLPDVAPPERIRRSQVVSDLRAKAGDAHLGYSRAMLLSDDRAYGEAMWRGIELYDRAGNLSRTISALELFVAERPDDPLAPDALLRLGRSYQAAGMLDRAVAAYQRNQLRHPQSLAAARSAVPLAQALMAQGPEAYSRAERVLLSVLDDNPQITPESLEFRQALHDIAYLFYRTGRFEQAIARLEESDQRYPDDPNRGQVLFLMADSYRKSAALLETRMQTALVDEAAVASELEELAAARRQRLAESQRLFDAVVELYRQSPPAEELPRLHWKLSHFYRADCAFDLGDYEKAIELYDSAAFRYQDDPAALAAYVQIVNAYCALGKLEEARTANERAKWLLRRMPDEAFGENAFALPRAHWEQWLKWTNEAGLW